MKILLPAAGLLALAFSACSPKPEDVCNCIRQSANDFMLKGERPSEAKLLAPCAEMLAKMKDNEAAKIKIKADYEDVRKAGEEKKLLAVDGKTPVFPPLTVVYDSVLSDFAHDYRAATYRYMGRPITTTVTARVTELDSTENGTTAACEPLHMAANGQEKTRNTQVRIPIAAAMWHQLARPSSEVVFDKKRHRSIEYDHRWYEPYVGGTLGDKRRASAYQLELFLKNEPNNLTSSLDGTYDNSEVFSHLAEEVRAGNYVLLDEAKQIGEKYSGKFYFNRLTAKGELELYGKNGYGLPVFTLKNAVILKNQDFLSSLLLHK